jgi:hypothetical protein
VFATIESDSTQADCRSRCKRHPQETTEDLHVP